MYYLGFSLSTIKAPVHILFTAQAACKRVHTHNHFYMLIAQLCSIEHNAHVKTADYAYEWILQIRS